MQHHAAAAADKDADHVAVRNIVNSKQRAPTYGSSAAATVMVLVLLLRAALLVRSSIQCTSTHLAPSGSSSSTTASRDSLTFNYLI
jgi:hypothetical protein